MAEPAPETYNSYSALSITLIIMPPPLIGGALSDAFVGRLSVCLTSVAYIGPKSRTERPRKTETGTEVAHVTRDSVTTFKVKRSKVKVTRPRRFAHRRVGASGGCSGGRENVLAVGNCLRCRLLGGARRFGAHGGRSGARAYRGGRPPTAC